jgi:hypothetical protein
MHPVMICDQNFPLSFHCLENPTVLHAIQLICEHIFIVFTSLHKREKIERKPLIGACSDNISRQ